MRHIALSGESRAGSRPKRVEAADKRPAKSPDTRRPAPERGPRKEGKTLSRRELSNWVIVGRPLRSRCRGRASLDAVRALRVLLGAVAGGAEDTLCWLPTRRARCKLNAAGRIRRIAHWTCSRPVRPRYQAGNAFRLGPVGPATPLVPSAGGEREASIPLSPDPRPGRRRISRQSQCRTQERRQA